MFGLPSFSAVGPLEDDEDVAQMMVKQLNKTDVLGKLSNEYLRRVKSNLLRYTERLHEDIGKPDVRASLTALLFMTKKKGQTLVEYMKENEMHDFGPNMQSSTRSGVK
jgi:spore coat protein CotF